MTIEVKDLIFPPFEEFKNKNLYKFTGLFGYNIYFSKKLMTQNNMFIGNKDIFTIRLGTKSNDYDLTEEGYQKAKEDICEDRMKKLLELAAGN